MSRPAVARRAFTPLTLAIALLTISCARGEHNGPVPGALSKPIAQYTADEFYTFAHSLSFGGGADRPRTCRKQPECGPTIGKRTTARVDAVNGQDSLSTRALPVNGVIAVQARNTGPYDEDRYGLRTGPYEYYVVVYPDTGGTATWRMQQLDTTPGARALTQVATGVFQPCNHPWSKPGKYRANFFTCDDSHMNDSTMKMGFRQDDDPIWMWCAEGCCVMMTTALR